MNYFITETGLSQLGINESEFVKIKNNSQYDIELRVLISENAPEYAVNVTPNPFGMYVWPQQGIREAADEVGIDKLMWGSDYPRTITAITYKMSYDFIVKNALLTDDEKAKFLGLNARRLFGFGDLPVPKRVKNMSE